MPNLRLSNMQLELLKMYSHDLPDSDLREVRKLLADYFAAKTIRLMDEVFEKNNLSEQDVEELLYAPS